ncbi:MULTISPECIES: site-specific integrase [Pseudomonas]|uniref:Site-specific integrase n=1 Tax=Pseudomonas monteilii TaxID=76759 RepID=A0AAP7FLY7_9PSED|nr:MULTISPECIES: site-specific integrase [Pseudomonas]MBA6100596.1 site-specific integrase [Pseudomonas monteilii]OAH50051.1 hypothetical protein AYJ70_16035 [Pseudomonas monteilii]
MSKILDLTFPALPYGTHEAKFDLASLLYIGASKAPADKVMKLIEAGHFGLPDAKRFPLVQALHDELSAQIVRGVQQVTVKTRIRTLRTFFSWCDQNTSQATIEQVAASYQSWVEHLIQRVRVNRDLKNMTAYRQAKTIDNLLKPCLRLTVGLLTTTRLRVSSKKNRALGTEADKQNLEELFRFGSLLMDLSNNLTVEAMTGPLPLLIKLKSGDVLTEQPGLLNIKIEDSCQATSEKNRFLERRAAIPPHLVFEKRKSLVNLRIEVEILIFISQTGMNLSQAARLKVGSFRYKTDGDDVVVYRVYKGRLGGEAEFVIFKEYVPLFKRYLEWVKILGVADDDRLFPFVYSNKIPVEGSFPTFQGIISRCRTLGIKHFRPMALRKSRINWLLRKSRSPDLVAEMAQHTKETLLHIYEEPHHQAAAVEISRFYRMTDPAVASVGPGMCIAPVHPIMSGTLLDGAYKPDCSTPAGCLFCEYQRDVDSEDYVWSLATYKYLKALELDRSVPSKETKKDHPITTLINRIDTKLNHFSKSGEPRTSWVLESENRMREGRFHRNYEGLIQLMELGR